MKLQSISEKIKQRRSQMLVHSYLYYELGTNIVSDHQWQDWANELTQLQAEYTEPLGFYDKEFADWDGTTGFHLPRDSWVMSKAQSLLTYNKKNGTILI